MRADSDAPRLRPLAVRLRGLPAPDALECAAPEGHVSLVIDDGTDLAASLVRELLGSGRPVAVMGFRHTLCSGDPDRFPSGVVVETAESLLEDDVANALGAIRSRFRGIDACIVVAAHDPHSSLDRELDLTSREALRSAFTVAKALHTALSESAQTGRASFITVTAMDGELGLTGRSGKAVMGGLLGLTKTLRLEWPGVFCRSVDLDPGIDANRGAELVMAELSDPNRLISEVGYGPRGRVTLITEPVLGGTRW